MKSNNKALLVCAALILGMQGVVHAVSPETVAKLTQKFEFFNQLPKEVQAQIIGLLDAGSFEEGMKQLSKLRLVSKQMRDLIDNEYTGKQIINMIAQRYPETPEYSLTSYAVQQNLPSSYAWLKDLAAKNPELKKRLVSEVSYIISSPGRANRELNQVELGKIKGLLAAGANPKDVFGGGWTLLKIAASRGDLEAALLFLDAGADINQVNPLSGHNPEKMTALDLALFNEGNAPEKLKKLIEFLKSRGGKTAAELTQK